VDIENCEFDDNESSWGGAICCKNGGSNISIKSNEFHDNTASNGGAVYLNNTDDMRISLNKFYDNSADNSGGAVFLDNSSDNVEFYNNLLNNNNADYGGGLAIDESDPEIYNNTIVYNDADSDGGGCYYDSLNCTLDFRNTIIYSNNANGFSNQLDPNPDYNHSDFTTCCIEGITAWSGNINDDPKFVNSGNHPYRISSDNGTRCIDVGTNGTASEREALDLKDHSRLTRVSAVYARIDIGAYEYEDPTPSYKLTSIGDNFDFKCKLSVYPNPAQNEFFLFFSLNEINDIKYEIVNSFGQQVLYKNLNKLPSGEHTIILDISDLKQGIYFIKLCIGNEKQLVRKLIKKD
ncbi:MAG: T9SS type A sorting domain-containing protein, partial [Bacteroidota bacterium]|nr:T9SS type A sorting domain-containing protein [Bacteroidota bacterium]